MISTISAATLTDSIPAGEILTNIVPDSIDSTKTTVDSITKKRTFFRRFADYFVNANKPHPNKKFDFSIIGGPQYSSTTSLGIGLVAAGVYRMDQHDTITQPSVMSVYGNVSITGFYLLGVFFREINIGYYTIYIFSLSPVISGVGDTTMEPIKTIKVPTSDYKTK